MRCLSILRGHTSVDAAALQGRTLLRLGRSDEAVEILEHGLAKSAELPHRNRAELEMLHASALANVGRIPEATAAFDDARAYVQASMCPALEAEFDLLEALAYFMARNPRRCEVGCAKALAPAPFVFGPMPHFVPIEHTRARVYSLRGYIAASVGHYGDQLRHARRSVDELESCPIPDEWLRLTMLSHVAMLAREMGDLREAAFVRRRLNEATWIEELAPIRYEILRSLAWLSAIRGDHLSAFRDLRAAMDLATSNSLRLAVSVDKAYLARELRQDVVAREELDYAERLSDSINWEELGNGEIDVLVRFAQALAPENAAKARSLLSRYRRLRGARQSIHPSSFDERARLIEVVADGIICRAEGRIERAIELLQDAFVRWTKSRHKWRAAIVAVELAELGAGNSSNSFLGEQAALYPNSWIALRAGAALSAGESTRQSQA